ncbi:MAG TPA: CapA family protein [Geobacteraceae bacterium]|nr:CapA family protein [Geobacteraceae bacterium]
MKGKDSSSDVTLFLCGDVMTGRGIDQILPHPGDPRIHEPYAKDARRYVDLAEETNGLIPRPVGFPYIWGDAIRELELAAPDARIVNLETSVTRSDDYWRGKGINYRMNPANIPCITTAGIDVCTLANNHVLDWGYDGLAETLRTLDNAHIRSAGAGKNLKDAEAPAVVDIDGKARILVFSFGHESSGIPSDWAASANRAGVNLLPDLSDKTVRGIADKVSAVKKAGDIAVASIHWGDNWGYRVPGEQIVFAHRLIEGAGVDIIHGHSSHHVKGIEVYLDKPIIYGCGDFINDYEGIGGYEPLRGDLSLMYFVRMNPSTGSLVGLRMIPTQMKKFRVNRASRPDAEWLWETLNREGKSFGSRVELDSDNALILQW